MARLISGDFAGIEAVLVGWFMGDPTYIRLAKLGIHAYVATHILGKPADLKWSDADLLQCFSEVKAKSKPVYEKAKRCVHGVNYGLTAHGMSEYYPEVFPKRSMAQEVIGIYHQVCPGLPKWHGAIRELANRQHYLGGPGVHPFGYKHYFWQVLSWTKTVAGWSESLGPDAKRAVSFFPQSTAAGVLAETCLWLFDPESPCYIGEMGPGGKTPLRALIHDEILLEVRDDAVEEALNRLQTAMERPILQLPCPSEWEIGKWLGIGAALKVGRNWAPKSEGNPEGMAGVERIAGDVVREPEEEEEEGGD